MSDIYSNRRFLTLLLFVTLLAAACGSGGGNPSPAAIRIGVIADVSGGPGSVDGQLLHSALDPAIARINRSGGINGRRLEVFYADPRNDPAEAMAQARRLLREKRVDVLYGGTLNSECAAMQELAGWVGVVYLMGSGCRDEALTGKTCNEYSFRLFPAGRQQTDPLAAYIAGNLGSRWAVVYRDYGPGWSQAEDWRDSLGRAGATVSAEIAIPAGGPNVSAVLSEIPLDGSISGIIVAATGNDQSQLLEALRRSGDPARYPIVTLGDPALSNTPMRDDTMDLITLETGPLAALQGDIVQSGSDSEEAQVGFAALRFAMSTANFSGKADTPRLIAALERLGAADSSDPFAGKLAMNASDHQGRTDEYVLRVQGQHRETLEQVLPEQLPANGSCHV